MHLWIWRASFFSIFKLQLNTLLECYKRLLSVLFSDLRSRAEGFLQYLQTAQRKEQRYTCENKLMMPKYYASCQWSAAGDAEVPQQTSRSVERQQQSTCNSLSSRYCILKHDCSIIVISHRIYLPPSYAQALQSDRVWGMKGLRQRKKRNVKRWENLKTAQHRQLLPSLQLNLSH